MKCLFSVPLFRRGNEVSGRLGQAANKGWGQDLNSGTCGPRTQVLSSPHNISPRYQLLNLLLLSEALPTTETLPRFSSLTSACTVEPSSLAYVVFELYLHIHLLVIATIYWILQCTQYHHQSWSRLILLRTLSGEDSNPHFADEKTGLGRCCNFLRFL